MRLACKRAQTLVEPIKGPSGDLGSVSLGRPREDLGVGLAGEPEVEQTTARPRKRRKKQRAT